ncbi:hypothetical protein DPF13_17820, partial [Salmonella enterica subsp. diarizonae]|nr:hypothetical protein [Salmonella enterica subsp. diarizonae]
DKNKLIDRSDFYYFSFAEIGTEQAINYYNSKISDGKKLNVIKLSSCNDRSDATVISIYEMASYLDIFKSMLLSIFAFFYFFKSKHTIKWCLQIYTAPSWFLVALVMNRIQGKVISSEHYDRWAVLIDSMLGEKGIQYTLIQHGSLRALDSSAYLLFKIPYKLKHLDKIIVFDEVEFQLFINNILDYNLAEIIKVEYSKPMLSLTQVSSNQLTLLVIGHSLCEKGQLKICSLINQQIENCSIYYKEHPKARASSKVRQFKFNFIIDDNFFPKVDVVISYPSTLAYKYEEMGTLVLFHGLHVVQTEEINEIVMKVILNRGEHGKSKL